MLKRPINVLIALIATLLTFVAIMPLFGYDLVIHKLALLPTDRYASDVTHLVLTRSAAFGTLAFFCINFLRRKRPWSSVAPMLVFLQFLSSLWADHGSARNAFFRRRSRERLAVMGSIGTDWLAVDCALSGK